MLAGAGQILYNRNMDWNYFAARTTPTSQRSWSPSKPPGWSRKTWGAHT